ncbi:MAG: CocE/NonD family hydrolase [Actinomycetota bacterium]|nr:CocE/NonD family hydrolase [Actinomycetota bacterium]
MEELRAWIPTAHGSRLAARLWLPEELPAPVLIEALPYRMDDLTASYSSEYERLCREGGFAVARIDLRGTGSSEGIAVDEYPAQEQADLADAIAWLAGQEWCTGRAGMYGTSYSGFNSLQVAAERPPALGAVVAIYSSDDRYTDDVHYTGGALRALDLLDYVLYMAALAVLPPVPAVFGEGWRDEWVRRLDASEPWLLRWLEEQTDGPYWRQGSLRPDYDRIECPTMLVAGWADGYRNNTFRTFEALRCPKQLLIGPWSHMSPSSSLPGPHIDLVPELIRWFDRWLRDEPNGVDEAPPIRVFVRRSTRPAADLAQMNGEWRYEPGWPLERSRELELRPQPTDGLDTLEIRGDVGTSAWISCAARLPWGQPTDQRADDAHSLTYDWGPFDEELEVLGHPRLEVSVTSAAPVAYLSAKLCDVFPDGTSALVTRGLLNLTHRRSSTDPAPLEPGEPTAIALELEATSWVFEPGHRIRLSLAGADWPNIWPPPHPGTLVVDRSSLVFTLPAVAEPAAIAETPAFAPPEADAHAPDTDAPQPPVVWRIEQDVLGRETRAVIEHGADYPAEHGAQVEERYNGTVGVSTEDPGSAWARATSSYRIAWPEADCRTEASLELRSDADTYRVVVEVRAEERAKAWTHERRFERVIPRRLQ